MSNLPSLREQFLDDTGAVLASGKLYFYEPTTTTDKAVYTTVALSVAHSNPVTLDSAGRAAEIYMTPGVTYRVILKDADLNTIWDIDTISPDTLDNGALSTQVYETAENPNHSGAVGDGVADESSEVQAAIDAAVSGSRSGVVDLLGRTYRCDTALSLSGAVTLRNGVLDFSACDDEACILVLGSQASGLALSGDEAEGQLTISMSSTSGLVSGDLVTIYEESVANTGELVIIESVSAGVSITLTKPIMGSFATANAAKVSKVSPASNVVLHDIRIIGNPSATGEGIGVLLRRTLNARLRNVTVTDSIGPAFAVSHSYGAELSGCYSEQIQVGYPVTAIKVDSGSSQTSVASCNFSYGGVIIGDTGGISNATRFTGCSLGGYLQIEEHCRGVVIDGCTLYGDKTGPSHVYGDGVTISNCDIRDAALSVFANSHTNKSCFVFSGNRVESQSSVAVLLFSVATGETMESIRVCGNTIYCSDTAGDAIDIRNSGTIRSMVVSGNTYTCAGTSGCLFLINTPSTGGVTDRLVISGNAQEGGGIAISMPGGGTGNVITSAVISDNAIDGGIVIANNFAVTRMIIRGNVIEESAASGISLVGATGTPNSVTISDNVVSGAYTTAGINVSFATMLAISGNQVTGPSGTNVCGIKVADSNSVVVCNNVVGASGGGIDFGISVMASTVTTTDCVISGNTIAGIANTALNAAIRAQGTSSGFFRRCVISGNTASSPFYGILTGDYMDHLIIAGNALVSSVTSGSPVVIVDGIASGGLKNLVVSGNTIEASAAGAYCLLVGSYCEGAAITGNVFLGSEAGNQVINMLGDAASGVNNFTICGNAIREGVYGILTANTASGIHDGNSFYSQSTAITSGTITAGDSV